MLPYLQSAAVCGILYFGLPLMAVLFINTIYYLFGVKE